MLLNNTWSAGTTVLQLPLATVDMTIEFKRVAVLPMLLLPVCGAGRASSNSSLEGNNTTLFTASLVYFDVELMNCYIKF